MGSEAKAAVLGVLFVAISLVVSIPVFAHHGVNLFYDTDQQVTVTGTVTEWRFANPHVRILMDVTDDVGTVVHWTVEGSSVYYWSKAGWNRGSLRPGIEVTVTVFPARDGTPAGVVSKIVLPDGRELAMETGS